MTRAKSLIALLTLAAGLALAPPARAQLILVRQSTGYTFTLPDVIAASDHVSGLTGQTGTVYLTRVTGSSGAVTKAASTNSLVEVDSANAPGQYTLTLTATETGALGYIKGYYKAATSDPVSFTAKVVAYDPDNATTLGLTNLDATVSSRNTGAVTLAAGQNVATLGGLAPPANFNALGITAGGKVSGVVLADTVTTYTGNTPQTGDSFARLGTAGSGLTTLGDARLANLDAAVSTRLATAGYTAPTTPPTTSAIATAVRDVDNTSPAAGSLGAKVNSAASAGDPWATNLPGAYASGTAGNLLGNRLDAAVSTRLATGGYTAPPTVAQIATATWQDLVAGSDFATTGSAGALVKTLTPAPTAAAVRQELDANSAKLANLTGPVATASQIPASFTGGLFSAPGIFATAALANAPTGSGGGGSGIQVATGTVTAAASASSFTATLSANASGSPAAYVGKVVIFQGGGANQQRGQILAVTITGSAGAYTAAFTMNPAVNPAIQATPTVGDTLAVF